MSTPRLCSSTFTGATLLASTHYNSNHSVDGSRLDFNSGTGAVAHAWCAATNDNAQWLAFAFEKQKQFHSVTTQGRGDDDQWVSEFIVKYSVDGINWFCADNARVFIGNTDRNTHVTNTFDTPFIARCVKICPTVWHANISMRAELFYFENENVGYIV